MSMKNEYIAFGRPNFSEEEITAITRVMRSGWIGMGKEVIAFEKELGKFVGAPHVITVNSCTSALFFSLLVLGVGPEIRPYVRASPGAVLPTQLSISVQSPFSAT